MDYNFLRNGLTPRTAQAPTAQRNPHPMAAPAQASTTRAPHPMAAPPPPSTTGRPHPMVAPAHASTARAPHPMAATPQPSTARSAHPMVIPAQTESTRATSSRSDTFVEQTLRRWAARRARREQEPPPRYEHPPSYEESQRVYGELGECRIPQIPGPSRKPVPTAQEGPGQQSSSERSQEEASRGDEPVDEEGEDFWGEYQSAGL